MARRRGRRRRSSSSDALLGWGVLIAIALVALATLANAVARNPAPTFVLAAAAVAVWLGWRHRKRSAAARRSAAVAKANEAQRQRWLATTFAQGRFTVTLTGFVDPVLPNRASRFLRALPEFRDRPEAEADDLAERVVHVGPQPVAEGIAQADAVRLKVALEDRGGRVRIREGVARSGSRREGIPAAVRREIWNRDGGRCVDCGSQERLEYDHIIPLAKGGSNTVRNLQLRCEPCNRKKGAAIA